MINEFFKSVREMQGLKQGDIAKLADISQSSIAKFESGASTLSLDTLRVIAPLISVNPEYLENERANPFRSNKLIKMFLPTRLAFRIDFSLIHSLVEVNKKLDFLLLSPNVLFIDKVTKDTVFGTPIYAIVIKDQDNNMFIFRRKEKSVLSAAITGEKKLEIELKELADKEGKIVHFTTLEIDKTVYNRIQSWDALSRKDLEPLFKKDIEFIELGRKLADICGRQDMRPDLVLEYIEDNANKIRKGLSAKKKK